MKGLYCFTHDLRLDDNALLLQASREVHELLCVYCINPEDRQQQHLLDSCLSIHRRQFINEALQDLDNQLNRFQQKLKILQGDTFDILSQTIQKFSIDRIYMSAQVGHYEEQLLRKLKSSYPWLTFVAYDNYTLFRQEQIPDEVRECQSSFSKFLKGVQQLTVDLPVSPVGNLPPYPSGTTFFDLRALEYIDVGSKQNFLGKGGESVALNHLESYFSSHMPLTYKETRNNLLGWDSSTKFSSWLSLGCLSPRRIAYRLSTFEKEVQASESTYWIYYELIWREFFQWYAKSHGEKLFYFSGILNKKPLTTFYPERFKKWSEASTPFPLVNACITELNQTGFLSNRARQLVASALINELGLDWRYGAAYFESKLIDYDVASNWGNWQYIAGVGAGNTEGAKFFNLELQDHRFDPQGEYKKAWGQESQSSSFLDSLDAADWPIEPK